MRNFGSCCTYAILALYLGKEFIGWMWWDNWEDDDDEPFPAPLLWGSWPIWLALNRLCFYIRTRTEPFHRLLKKVLVRCWPKGDAWEEPTDADGRTPTEWLVINVVGIWNVKHWYDGEYDWGVRQRWEEYLKPDKGPEETSSALEATELPETQRD